MNKWTYMWLIMGSKRFKELKQVKRRQKWIKFWDEWCIHITWFIVAITIILFWAVCYVLYTRVLL